MKTKTYKHFNLKAVAAANQILIIGPAKYVKWIPDSEDRKYWREIHCDDNGREGMKFVTEYDVMLYDIKRDIKDEATRMVVS